MTVLSNPANALGDGRKVVAAAGTAERLSASSVRCRSLVVTAESDNTGVVVVGGATVVAALATRRGTPLVAGQSVALDVTNLKAVFIDSTVNGDGVTFTYLTA